MIERKTLYTLGGCATHELGKEFDNTEYNYKPHLWRRPTIALCSKRISRFRFDIKKVPDEYMKYFINDCSKLQFDEVLSLDPKSIFIFDITRDVVSGVIEVEPGCYVLNPLDLIGMLEGLNTGTMNEDVAKSIYGENYVKICPRENTEQFFEIWKAHFDVFADKVSNHFDQVILPKIKYTEESLNNSTNIIHGQRRLEQCNAMLERMYDYVESIGSIRLISISDNMYATGKHVEWGGPHIAHYTKETYAVLCQKISDYLNDNHSNSDHYLYMAARTQTTRVEKLLDEVESLNAESKTLKTSIETIKSQLSASQTELANCQDERDSLLTQINEPSSALVTRINEQEAEIETLKRALDESQNSATSLANHIRLREEEITTLHTHICAVEARALKAKALAEQPLGKIVKRRVARRTRTLRTKLLNKNLADHKKLTFTRA